jgi:peptidoglycan/LPS O-acetylase OafA/YrhL
MHYLTIVFIVWAVAATVLLALLAYRSTLTRYEEDCLFLDGSNEHQQKEQETILARVRKVQPAVRFMTVATCVMSAALVGTFLFQLIQQLNAPAS